MTKEVKKTEPHKKSSSMPQNYYFLVGGLSFLAGLYVDQNYNVPDIKYWVQHAEEVVCAHLHG